MNQINVETIVNGHHLVLKPEEHYELVNAKGEPAVLEKVLSGIKIETPEHGVPATIHCRANRWDAITFLKGSENCTVSNVRFDLAPKMRAIRLEGKGALVKDITISDRCLVGIYLNGATNTMIGTIRQDTVTRGGLIYSSSASILNVNDIHSVGNYYENELRFHGLRHAMFSNFQIYAANPANDLPREHGDQYAGLKDNALRMHDGDNNRFTEGLLTGFVRLGVMGDYNGGQEQYELFQKERDPKKRISRYKEYKRLMNLRCTRLELDRVSIYGNLRLEAGLEAVIRNSRIVYLGSGNVIRNDGRYAYGDLARPAPLVKFIGCDICALSVPGKVKAAFTKYDDVVKVANEYILKKKYDKNSRPINEIQGIEFRDCIFNGKPLK